MKLLQWIKDAVPAFEQAWKLVKQAWQLVKKFIAKPVKYILARMKAERVQ